MTDCEIFRFLILILLFTDKSEGKTGDNEKIRILFNFLEYQPSRNSLNLISNWRKGISARGTSEIFVAYLDNSEILASLILGEISEFSRKSFELGLKSNIFNINSSIVNDGWFRKHHSFNILDDDRIESILDTLKESSKIGLLKKPFVWIIFCNYSIIDRHKESIYPGVDSRIYIFEKKSETYYTITSIHKVNSSSELFDETIAVWNFKKGFTEFHQSKLTNFRNNLRDSAFKLSLWTSNPMTNRFMNDYRFTHIDASIRFTYKIQELLIDMLNANAQVTTYHGPYLPVFEDVRKGNAIMSAIPLFFIADRLNWMDYLAPNTPSYLRFIFRAPPLSFVSNIFTKPFSKDVWYCSIVLCLIIFGTMYLIVSWEWKEEAFRRIIENKNQLDATRPTVDNVAIVQLGIVSQQGSDTELKSLSGRIVFVISLVTFLFLYTAYSGMIVAILQSTSNTIKNMDDLWESGMELGVENLPYITAHFGQFSNMRNSSKKISFKNDKNFIKLDQGIQRMRQDFFAFYTEQTSAYKVIGDTFQESEKCKLREISYASTLEPWIVGTKNHVYKETMKIGLFRLKEVGFYNVQRKRIFFEKPQCTSRINSFVSAGIVDTYSAFLFFAVGFLISFSILILEFFLKSSKIFPRK